MLVTNASAADSRLFRQKCIMHRRRRGRDHRKIWIPCRRVGKFGSGERALRVRGWKRTLVGRACYKSFSPCSVIPESGYPFSGSVLRPQLNCSFLRTLLSRRRPTGFTLLLLAVARGNELRLPTKVAETATAAASARIHAANPNDVRTRRLMSAWYHPLLLCRTPRIMLYFSLLSLKMHILYSNYNQY